ncbi:MAG: mitochondrial fission ELM1 family protein [Rhodospirillales bacterium]
MPPDVPDEKPVVWALIDDRAGNGSQVRGVADALGLTFDVKNLRYNALAKLPNAILGRGFATVAQAERAGLTPPWPDLVIAAGRRTAPIARAIKRANANKTFLCQIMNPGNAGRNDFDLIAVPAHDGLPPLANEITVIGAPHGVSRDKLALAAGDWRLAFADLPRPLIAVIVGGSTRKRDFTPAMARDLGRTAAIMARKAGGALLITTSRRTGQKQTDALMAEITVPHHAFRWGDAGANPYFGYLALADAVIVTGDSVSMVSECCATPKPVYIFAPEALIGAKHGRLLTALYDGGYARPLEGRLEIWPHPPLNAADTIASEIRKRMAQR